MFHGKSLPCISECRRFKCSFNETWLLELDADLPLCANSTAGSRHPRRTVVQIMGAQLMDTPIFKIEPGAATAAVVVKALEISRAAGVHDCA